MGHGAEHHIEHAEHAAHAAHDDFNKMVTMTIAIVAAVLACVTMMSHRSHNDTLRLQGEALKLQNEASIESTKAANAWAYYQNKNTFNFESEIVVDLLKVLVARDGASEEVKEIVDRYEDNIQYYTGDKNNRMSGKTLKAKKTKSTQSSDEKVEGKLKKAEKEARKHDDKAAELLAESKKSLEESHVEHAKAARFDFGELGLQFGVVLCSLAILTKSRSFWVVGIISAIIGAAIALSGLLGLFMGHH